MKTYNIIYETTNNINGKIYRGYHSTDNINDGYLGSGSLIKSAISKYGKENFHRKILEVTSSKEEMFELEKKYVDVKFISRDDTYNLMTGGQGCSSHSEETKQKMSESSKGKGRPHTQETKDKLSTSAKKYYENNDGKFKDKNHSEKTKKQMSESHKGKILSEEHKQNLSDSLSGVGCFWYGKSLSDEHREKLRQQTLGRKWMNKDGTQTQVKLSEIEKHLIDGWSYGMNPRTPIV